MRVLRVNRAKFRQNIGIFLFCFLSLQCNYKEPWEVAFTEKEIVSIQSEGTILKHTRVAMIPASSYKSIGIVDTTLLLIDEYKPPFLRFYSTRTMNYLGSYGVKGDKGNEFISPKYDNQYVVENDRTFFYLSDAQKFLFCKVDLEKAISDTSYTPELQYKIPPSLILKYVSLFINNKGQLLGNYRGTGDYQKTGRIFIYDTLTKKMNWIPYFPKRPFALSSSSVPYYYYSFCGFNTERQIFTSSMYLFKRIDFIDFSKRQNISSVYSGSDIKLPEANEAFPLPNTKTYFFASFSGAKYLYSLCLNRESKYYTENKYPAELHIYNWNGTLKKIVLLDQSRLNSFVVDEREKKLFALQYSNSSRMSNVIHYDLNSLDIY